MAANYVEKCRAGILEAGFQQVRFVQLFSKKKSQYRCET